MFVSLLAWVLIRGITLTRAGGSEIPITLYTDNACDTPSTTAVNISLEIGVCAVTPGLGSFDLQPYPCSSGSVTQYVFTDTACGQVAGSFDYYRTGSDGHCYAAYKGALAAIMLSCDQTSPGQPASTTTIDVGPIATAGSPASSASSTSPTVGSDGNGDGSSSNSGSSASGWSSLDLGTRIGIIVSLAVGIPPILLTIYLILMKKKREQRAAQEEAQGYGTPMPTYPYSHGGSHGAFQPWMGPPPPRQPLSLQQKWAGYNNMTSGGGGA